MELGLHENDGRDMISNLPDCIIGLILSFLPTKDAVRTCVLSKRWKNLWTFVTELSFQEDRDPIDDTQIKRTQFLHFVHRVLLHLVDGLTINSFSLSVYYYYDDSHLNECISCILSRKVKKIWFDSQNVHRVFPFYPLFQFESLEELFLINCNITVPSFNTLSSLTTLKLSLVTVTCYKPNELKDLTLEFPVLRKFVTEECWWTNVKSVTIQAPLLEVVSMDYGPYVGSNAEIKFCASHLTMFSYAGCFVSETISLDAVHIVSANIMLYDSIKSLEETRLFVSKLMSINAASLKLCGLRNKKVLQGVKLSLNNILGFQILGHLDLDFAPDDILFSFLLKSPRLETLVLKGVAHLHKDVFTSVMVPHCFLSSFKVFQFKGFNANEQDLCLVKFVLANAANLEKMTISPAFWLRCADVDLEKVKEQILSIPKCSKNCKIEVSDISSS